MEKCSLKEEEAMKKERKENKNSSLNGVNIDPFMIWSRHKTTISSEEER